ncbi:hypothetical protein FD03_GL001442 [Companilactobacillus nodensis DSM 19682 = JCM 14932 = NBRC 107160]|uniref:Uncharacterized protein n=1 Tax=Companilactobacillus nodensis DSM 19682 = JCM 14932 = NBRC 107160 TaxID=1423775 RepID=A0A0R1KJ70_9LACO|nr:hypothetical protein FD03_GL001442 [Companilactobacillus nodensis DSM 19682 = JCM 14932 = NBRC 107160]
MKKAIIEVTTNTPNLFKIFPSQSATFTYFIMAGLLVYTHQIKKELFTKNKFDNKNRQAQK